MNTDDSYTKDKERITSLIKEHYVSLESFFTHPVDKQGLLMISVFADFVGDLKLQGVLAEKQLQRIETYVKSNDAHLERMDTFKTIIQELRHEFIQRHPQKALDRIARIEVSDFIKSAFEITDPESLLYNTELNQDVISHIFQVYTGHRYDNEIQGLVTHIAGYKEIEIGYSNQPLENIESFDNLIKMMKEAIRKTQLTIEGHPKRIKELQNRLHKQEQGEDIEQ